MVTVVPYRMKKNERTEEAGALIHLRNKYRSNLNFKYKLEATWYQTILFTHGLQYVSFNLAAGKPFFIGTGDPKRVRVAYNVMMRMAEDHKSSFISTPYEWQVSPLTEDTEDILAARRGTDLVKWWEKTLSWKKKRCQLADIVVKTGNGLAHYGWDWSKGTATELVMPDGNVMKVNAGELFIEIDMPFRWYFHPHATCVEESPWAIRRTALPRSVVAKMLPKFDIDQVPDIQTGEAQNFWEYSLLNFSAQHGYSVGGSESLEKGEGFLEVFQLWTRPGEESANEKTGDAMIALGNGGGPMYLAEEKKNQYDTLPVIHFGQVDTPGRLWKDGWLPQCVSPQRALNRGISQDIENANLIANPQLIVPDNGFAPQSVTNRVGGIIRQDPNALWRPFYLQPPGMPQFQAELKRFSLEMLDVIAAPFGPSSSRAEQKATSGVHLKAIQEQNQAKLVSQAEMWEASSMDLFNGCLDVYRKFAIIPRRYEGGCEGRWMDFYLSGKQLTKKIRFEITPRSSLPKSPTTAFATHLEILKVLPWLSQDESYMNHFWQDLAYGDMVKTFRDRKEDSTKAYRNVTMCRQGLQPIPDEWDDPRIHMPIYESEMNTDSYRDDWDDTAKIRLYALWKMFIAFQMMKAQQQQMLLQAMLAGQGGAGQPGAEQPGAGGPQQGPQSHMAPAMRSVPSPYMDQGGNGGGGPPATPGMIGA